MDRKLNLVLVSTASMTFSAPVDAQLQLDRSDPSIVARALPLRNKTPNSDVVVAPTTQTPAAAPSKTPLIASSIVVEGGTDIERSAFSAALAGYIGRDLSGEDLARLAAAVASTARARGYPFASALIEPQKLTDGILRVTLQEGRIAAVRVIGATNPLADRILTRILANGRAPRAGDLERAILLVGELPGVTVKSSKYVVQDGFGILLVTIEEKRASAYLQIDNRGSEEVGPYRSTLLTRFNGVIGQFDELSLILAQTPLRPPEFFFLRGRYSLPIGTDGNVAAIYASFGQTRPGGALAPLNVLGRIVDAAASYSIPIVRRRQRSISTSFEVRALESEQSLLGTLFRDDKLVTLAASLNGTTRVGRGRLVAEVTATAGLPVAGVTHDGDPHASRPDGDARFGTIGYSIDWSAPFAKHFAIELASSGQAASRPLLASAEISAGGPAFGRGYDYAERTGDNGALGSAELQADAGSVLHGVIDRLQFYGFVDGGYVSNLRGGAGGGALLSTGAGARVGGKLIDSMFELAFPLNADRFDTGDRRPRFSFRISRAF